MKVNEGSSFLHFQSSWERTAYSCALVCSASCLFSSFHSLHPVHQLDQQSLQISSSECSYISQLLMLPKSTPLSCFSFLCDHLTQPPTDRGGEKTGLSVSMAFHLRAQRKPLQWFQWLPTVWFSFSLLFSLPHMNSWSISFPNSLHDPRYICSCHFELGSVSDSQTHSCLRASVLAVSSAGSTGGGCLAPHLIPLILFQTGHLLARFPTLCIILFCSTCHLACCTFPL